MLKPLTPHAKLVRAASGPTALPTPVVGQGLTTNPATNSLAHYTPGPCGRSVPQPSVNTIPQPSRASEPAAPAARGSFAPSQVESPAASGAANGHATPDDPAATPPVDPAASAPVASPPPPPAAHPAVIYSGQSVRFHRPDNDPAKPGRRYCLITPCRDEQEYAEHTLRSVSQQTEPPSLWIVVDDGSTDQTPQILKKWQEKLPYLRVITRPNRGERKLGGGVIDAFYEGYTSIDPHEFDFICKIDLDLELPPGYFAGVMDVMESDPRLGTFSGKPYFRSGGRLISEMCGDENAVGMIKFYRVAAFEQIGGFVRELMWDGIDGHRCRMLGWRAESRDDPNLRFVHLRPMGTSHRSWLTGRQRHGRGQFFMGTGPAYMLASSLYRLTRPPLVVGGLAMMWGYLRSWGQGMDRYDDPQFRNFLRRYHRLCLLMGKQRATQKVDSEQATVFRAPVSRS